MANQYVEFIFLNSYQLLADLKNSAGTVVANDVPAVFSRSAGSGLAYYRINTGGTLTGNHTLEVYATGVFVLAGSVILDGSAGVFSLDSGCGYTLPRASDVLLGVDRGDGVLGTLVPICNDSGVGESGGDYGELINGALVEILSRTGINTGRTGRITEVLPDGSYTIKTSDNKIVQLTRDRLTLLY